MNQEAGDCFCHYLPYIIGAIVALIVACVAGSKALSSYRQWRERVRLERERRIREEEKRVHDSTRFMYRSAPPK
jgi:hypothetical protein